MPHTPGPWGLMAGRGNGPNGATIICRGLVIARTSRDADSPVDQKWSNARLIAAAPELLEALKEVVALSDRKTDVWDRAHAAIERAEGR